MRYLLLFALYLACNSSILSQDIIVEDYHLTSAEVDSTTKYFNCGQEVIEINFKITNTGNMPLIIKSCKTSVGCWVAHCSSTPIPVGEYSIIKTKFNAIGREGPQRKTLTLDLNTEPNIKVLKIQGNIHKQ